MAFLLIIFGGLGAAALWWVWSRRRARVALLAQPLSDWAREVVAEEVPLTRKLPTDLRARFEGKVNLFLHQVGFIGCDGLEVTDEMRLSIAAQACLLIANSDAWYRDLRTVLIYPGAFQSMRQERQGYVVTERRRVRLGESWQHGPVVLSWQHSEAGALDAGDGRNVVLHEFAHQLDGLSGQTDGAPVLARGQNFEDWRRVVVEAFERHLWQVQPGRRTVIDEYGAEGPEEFFAVSIELFFERPHALEAGEPELYDQLRALLGLDPASWD
ncbi:M90 family metallopeptidase [Aliiroseovarius sp.]|uniref:M90 family metallopeptidase n=1 Tax=Aliiroseovarius sp. TaxID=1872442 RepID=UPI002617CB8D|nr:M90 family metallopeptidase [Aliiroseovarius sp.]